jgi:PhnB protein
MAAQPIPAGYHSVTPYLIIKGAADALGFYKRAFSATERMRLDGPGGSIAHAEIQIGDSIVMLADEFPEMGALSPHSIGGSPVGLCLYVADVDTVFQRAIAAGATEERPVRDQFYGDRSGTLRDPFGHKWTIATHKEDLTPEQINERAQAWAKNQGAD